MKLDIFCDDYDLTPSIQQYAEKRLERLDRYLPNITDVRLDLREENTRQANRRSNAQITVRHQRGAILRGEVTVNSGMEAAIQGALDHLYRQIERFKGKQSRKGRERYSATLEEQTQAETTPTPVQPTTNLVDGTEATPIIVRRKPVQVTTMTEDEAIEQMELLGHTFFIFQNSDGAMGVVYKRRDGGYGLLIPSPG